MAGQGKGVLFVHLRTYTNARHGGGAWERLLAASEPGDKRILEGILLAGGWYPVGTWNRVLSRYLVTHHAAAPDAGMTEFGAYIAQEDLNSLVKMVLKLGSPEFILKRTGWLWSRYFDQGVFTAQEETPQRWRMWLDAPTAENDGPGAFTCGPGVAPWLAKGLELSAARNGKVEHVKCRFKGAPRCEYVATWNA